jgi:spore coat polysaccharide biosynthesis protein SpsF
MLRVVAIVQARMGSHRLPGKVLADLAGASMLARVVERVLDATMIDSVVIATSTAPADDAIVDACVRLAVPVFRGSETDVLSRYVGAARAHRATTVVRVTADCPLLDPEVIDRVVSSLGPEVDYASNTHERTYPRGLDVEALHADTLWRLDRLGTSSSAREHVTAFLMEAPALFRIRHVRADHDDSQLRWTVDTPEDLAMVRGVYERFQLATVRRPYRELVTALVDAPELSALNAHVEQKPWTDHAK